MKVELDKKLLEKERSFLVSVQDWTKENIQTWHNCFDEILDDIMDKSGIDWDPASDIHATDFGTEYGDRNGFFVCVDEEGIHTQEQSHFWMEIDLENTIELGDLP